MMLFPGGPASASRCRGGRRAAHAIKLYIASALAMVVLSACILGVDTDISFTDTPTVPFDPSTKSVCEGGVVPIAWNNRPSLPGIECGCGGVLACDTDGELMCVNDVPEPGFPCGTCADGSWLCDNTGSRPRWVCAGASVRNACGGCEEFTDPPGVICETSGQVGVSVCNGPDATRCITDPSTNICGGSGLLTAPPGSSCGTCNQGVNQCTSAGDDVVCAGAGTGVNACGGCEALDVVIGAACGCEGEWACAGARPVCLNDRRNPCGGCTPLAAELAQTCPDGRPRVCDGPNATRCGGSDNPCGGIGVLDHTPGASCGACNGVYICAAPNVTVCYGDVVNACGGCTPLAEPIGGPCGTTPNARYACGDDGTPFCDVPLCENQQLDPGEVDVDCGGNCPPCTLGRTCNGNTDCASGRCIAGSCAGADRDRDGIADAVDNCPFTYNPDQRDTDGDGLGDVCDPDIDGDGVPNDLDNCPFVFNPDQRDRDRDGVGDACDPDIDGDGVLNEVDNCPLVFNPGQEPSPVDGVGLACWRP